MGEQCHSHEYGSSHNHSHDAARPILLICLAVNFTMFIVEVVTSFLSGSISLLADSADFLSDSFSYAITLYALNKSLSTKVRVSRVKASAMLIISLSVVISIINTIFFGGKSPSYEAMGIVGTSSLFANLFCAWLLYRYRASESNLRSSWLCSRNDALNNLAIIVAAAFTYFTASFWPDIIVAAFITILGTVSAIQIFKQTKIELEHQGK